MSAIIIPLEQAVTVPATQEKTYDAIWISSLMIRTHPPTDQTGAGLLDLEILPMNSTTFETHREIQSIRTTELMLAVSQVPEVATAMGAILLAITPLKAWIAARQAELEEQNNP
jgi:hypothetical protein